jgi:hypothetical protein
MVWTLWKREKSFGPVGNRTLAIQPVAIPTKLSWLHCDMKHTKIIGVSFQD